MWINDEKGNAIRPPAVAGHFYPQQPPALRQAIEQAFVSPLGPGALPTVTDGQRRLVGIIVPHAGYPYSAQGAAWGFAEVAQDGKPGAIVLLGVNHRGAGTPLAISPAEGWHTPLGVIPVAQELGRELQRLAPELAFDERAHSREHSLEVQVPFIQFLFGALPILPISVGGASVSALFRLGSTLAALARKHDLLCIASTDFSHYVPQAQAERLDRLALDQIARVNPTGLLDTVLTHAITMCGVNPVAILLTAAKELGVRTANILHYHTSGDVTGDRQEVVGYGTAALSR